MNYLFATLLAFTLLACGSEPDADRLSGPPPVPTAVGTGAAEQLNEPYGNLTPAEFTERMQDENVVILDVRTAEEVANGKIDGATELDYRDPDFASKLEALDREPTYLVYCAVGGRSSQTCEMMSEAGFAKVYNLEGGYTAWKDR